jgi:hypothetical protein
MEESMPELKRNHRTLGIVKSEQNGYTILETAPHEFTAARTNELLPVTSKEITFEIRMALNAVIERARFLGMPDDALRGLLDDELHAE